MAEIIQHERNDVCILEFQTLKDKLEKMEERQTQRDDDMKVIEKAIVAIQVANETTAQTLSRLDAKLEKSNVQRKESFWNDTTKKLAMRYGTIIIVVLILALVGTNALEALEAAGMLTK